MLSYIDVQKLHEANKGGLQGRSKVTAVVVSRGLTSHEEMPSRAIKAVSFVPFPTTTSLLMSSTPTLKLTPPSLTP